MTQIDMVVTHLTINFDPDKDITGEIQIPAIYIVGKVEIDGVEATCQIEHPAFQQRFVKVANDLMQTIGYYNDPIGAYFEASTIMLDNLRGRKPTEVES